jgi:hypothetical protein
MGMIALHFKLPYTVYGTNYTAPIFFILLAFKKSTSIKHTSPSKPSIAATMDMCISSDSSLSSTNGGYYAILPHGSDFVPTSLPTGHGTIPIDVKDLCQIAVLSPS